MAMRTCSVLLLLCLRLCCLASEEQLLNGGFEIPDPDRATQWFTPPLHWEWQDIPNNQNYIGLHTNFTPNPEQGQADWSIPGPVEGDYFVLLSTGDVAGPGSSYLTEYSAMWQPFTAYPGDRLSGYYFFGTCDYMHFEDHATIKLMPVDPNEGRPTVLVRISVKDVGDYESTEGWLSFSHTFTTDDWGEYLLYCEVRDALDRGWKSYLALDNVRLCREIPSNIDLNYDCAVDYQDFAIMSRLWLADCEDPAVIADPNIPCHVVGEPNAVIDLEKVIELGESWLEYYGDLN